MTLPAGTTIVAAKRALRDLLKARPALDGVLVNYGDPAERGRREQVWLGRVRQADQEPVALRSGTRTRDEVYELWVHVDVASKATAEENEARAVDLIREVESVLANDPKLGGTEGVLFAVVTEMSMNTVETGDGPSTSAVLTVTVRARLR